KILKNYNQQLKLKYSLVMHQAGKVIESTIREPDESWKPPEWTRTELPRPRIDLNPTNPSSNRRFIEGFSKIARPMTKLTQKKIKFEWDDKQEEAFQVIKQKLCSAPILALPEGSEDFVVYCDASIKGLGAVLMQREKAEVVAIACYTKTDP
nr:putative reverse transcriptase domain-containing protein [Tanacetum cinerariifolium]